jgi:hypothetical protein
MQRASKLFGLVSAESLNAANVGKLVADVKAAAGARRAAVANLVVAVSDRAARYSARDAAGEIGDRQLTAQSAQALLASLVQAGDSVLVATLAAAPLETSEAAVGRAIAQAQAAADSLAQANWQLFDAVRGLTDHRQGAGQAIAARLAEVLRNDEHVIPLKTKLDELVRDAVALLSGPATPAPPPPTPGLPPATPPVPPLPPMPAVTAMQKVIVEESERSDLDAPSASALLQKLKAQLDADSELELTLHWRLQRKGGTRP